MYTDGGAGSSASSAPNGVGSIADMLRAAAEEVLTATVPPGFAYIEEYGMYYSHESGYYYDQNTNLFYHSETQTYYYYDETDHQYKVYKNMQPPEWSRRTHRRAAQHLLSKEAVDAMTQEDVDVCETVFDVLERLEDPEDRAASRKRYAEEREKRDRERRQRRDEEDYRRNVERSARRRQVFDGDDFVDIDEDRHRASDDLQSSMTSSSNRRSRREELRRWRDRECGDRDRRHHRERTWSRSSEDSRPRSEREEEEDNDEDERVRMMREEGYDQPACVRIINTETADLFIVTLNGALIGNAPECDVKVIDNTLPPRLAQIVFVEDKKKESSQEADEGEHVGDTDGRRDRGHDRSRDRDSGGSGHSRSRDRSRERPGDRAEQRRIAKRVNRRQLAPNASRKERRAFERRWGKFEEETKDGKYYLRVLSSAAKCTLSGQKVKKGDPDVLMTHGARLVFAKTNVFSVHIHSGRNTCAECEPGLVMASVAASAPIPPPASKPLKGEAARRAQLRQMKAALGMEEQEEEKEEKRVYTDRAKLRRKMFGSELEITKRRRDGMDDGERRRKGTGTGGIYDACEAKPLPGAAPIVTATDSKASAQKALPKENKGFKMLQMMGWKEGDGLGRKGDGRVEPVANALKADRAGLGSSSSATSTVGTIPTAKEAIWEKARSRFNQIAESEKRS